MKRSIILYLIFFHLCASAQNNDTASYVLLVSFDGFRSDYVERFNLPNFRKAIAEGSQAEGLIPSFPSKTFPNHYTIVTGLYPGHHGLVDNTFYDPTLKEVYSMKNREAVSNVAYYGGTPIWTLARQHGIKTASYYWVGSEVEDESRRPDHYFLYDQSVSYAERIDQVKRWLQLPQADRPRLITLYFSSPDTESHANGPWAEKTKEAVIKMDSVLGELVKKVRDTGLKVNILLVSDHGMSELKKANETFVSLDDLISHEDPGVRVVNGGTQAHFYIADDDKKDSVYQLLKARAKNFEVYKREEFPDRWNYDHPRSGDLLMVVDSGKYIITGNRRDYEKAGEAKTFGAHGFDYGAVKEMQGIFYAFGPNIKKGQTIKAIENIHVYPLMAKILDLPLPPIDGNFTALEPIYHE